MSLGFCLAGYRPLVGVDRAMSSIQTYEYNLAQFGALGLCSDITERGFLDHLKWLLEARGVRNPDVIISGLPQSSFSVARRRTSGSPDSDKAIYLHVVEAVQRMVPKIVVLETLPAFETADSGANLKDLTDRLNTLGYQIASWKIRAMDYGVPQPRERFYILAGKTGGWLLTPPPITHGKRSGLTPFVTTYESLADLPAPALGGPRIDSSPLRYAVPPASAYQSLMRKLPLVEDAFTLQVDNHVAIPHGAEFVERVAHILPGQHLGDLVRNLAVPSHLKPKKGFNSRCQRPIPDEPCISLTAHCMDELLHYSHHRSITPREAARLQSFPDWFTFLGVRSGHHGSVDQDQYEQIGSATPSLVAKAVAEAIRLAI